MRTLFPFENYLITLIMQKLRKIPPYYLQDWQNSSDTRKVFLKLKTKCLFDFLDLVHTHI